MKNTLMQSKHENHWELKKADKYYGASGQEEAESA